MMSTLTPGCARDFRYQAPSRTLFVHSFPVGEGSLGTRLEEAREEAVDRYDHTYFYRESSRGRIKVKQNRESK